MLPRNEAVLKDDVGAQIVESHVIPALGLNVVGADVGLYEVAALSVSRAYESNSVILVLVVVSVTGNDEQPMSRSSMGDHGLGSAYEDTVSVLANLMYAAIGVFLLADLAAAQSTVALSVSQSTGNLTSGLLDLLEPVVDSLVVLGAVLFVHVVSYGENGLHGVPAGAG